MTNKTAAADKAAAIYIYDPSRDNNAHLMAVYDPNIAAAPFLLQTLETIALHAPSLDATGIRELCDEAIAVAKGPTK